MLQATIRELKHKVASLEAQLSEKHNEVLIPTTLLVTLSHIWSVHATSILASQVSAAREQLASLQKERSKLETEVREMSQEVAAKNQEIKSLQEQASLVRVL